MLYCGVILFTALSLVSGHLPSIPSSSQPSENDLPFDDTYNTPLPTPTSPSNPAQNSDADETDADEVMGFCFFGSFPTATCMVKCFWKNRSAYCDEESNCRCGLVNEMDDMEGSYRATKEDFTTLQPDFDYREGGVVGVCFFGHIPSPSCMFHCSVRGQSAVCDEESRCLCENRTNVELSPQSHSLDRFFENGQELSKHDSEREDDGSIVFLFFDLSSLFESEDMEEKEDISDSYCPIQLWTIPNILAMAVLTLFVVLLVLELTLCCKRRYSQPCKQHLQTMVSTEVLEKGMIIGKQ